MLQKGSRTGIAAEFPQSEIKILLERRQEPLASVKGYPGSFQRKWKISRMDSFKKIRFDGEIQ